MNEMNDKYCGYKESLDKIKVSSVIESDISKSYFSEQSERKLFEHECARLKTKLTEEQEMTTKLRRDYESTSEEVRLFLYFMFL